MIEAASQWPSPSMFMRLRRSGLRDGKIATVLREPVSRLFSCYRREIQKMGMQMLTLDRFQNLPYSQLWSHTLYNEDNFYVLFLNGMGSGHSNRQRVRVDQKHLKQAQRLLLEFDVVLRLEEPRATFDAKLAQLLGVYINTSTIPRLTNSWFSSFFTTTEKNRPNATTHADLLRLIQAEESRTMNRARENNALDIQLYDWATDVFASPDLDRATRQARWLLPEKPWPKSRKLPPGPGQSWARQKPARGQ